MMVSKKVRILCRNNKISVCLGTYVVVSSNGRKINMKILNLYFSLLLVILFNSCGQPPEEKLSLSEKIAATDLKNVYGQPQEERLILGKTNAESELKESLSNNSTHNFFRSETKLITDSSSAIHVAEPILYNLYGKDNINRQRPYEIYHLDHYWYIAGTLPLEMHGGTFVIILDSNDGKIIKLGHSQ